MNYVYSKPAEEFKSNIKEGYHRVAFDEIEPTVSRTGKDMWKIILTVSNSKIKIYYNLVFNTGDNKEYTDKTLKDIYDSFTGIKEGNLDYNDWIGKTGIAKLKNETYNGKTNLRVHYFAKEATATKANNNVPLAPYSFEPVKEADPGEPTTFDDDVAPF